MDKAFKIIVKGRVQGVGYRWFAREQATKLNILGYVKNLSNGNVELSIEGAEQDVMQYIHTLRTGPSFSNVTDLDIYELDPTNNFKEFKVTF